MVRLRRVAFVRLRPGNIHRKNRIEDVEDKERSVRDPRQKQYARRSVGCYILRRGYLDGGNFQIGSKDLNSY